MNTSKFRVPAYLNRFLSLTGLIAVCTISAVSGQESAGNGMNELKTELDIQNARVQRIQLDDIPNYIIGEIEDGIECWYIRTERGFTYKLEAEAGGLTSRLVENKPQVLVLSDYDPPADRSQRTWPFPGGSLSIDSRGRYTLRDKEGRSISRGRTLVDAMPVFSNGRLALLTQPGEEYRHGILGDPVEARGFIVFDTSTGNIAESDELPAGTVFEARFPIWADVNGDGMPELLVTASNADVGAAILIFNSDGSALASSQAIGTGYRWLHLLGAGQSVPGGEAEILAIRTPHLGGVLEYFRLEGKSLVKVYSTAGYSTHQIGSRNLGMAVLGFLNDNGYSWVLLPSQDYRRLNAIAREVNENRIIREFRIDGRLSTNIAVLENDSIARLAWGSDNGWINILRD